MTARRRKPTEPALVLRLVRTVAGREVFHEIHDLGEGFRYRRLVGDELAHESAHLSVEDALAVHWVDLMEQPGGELTVTSDTLRDLQIATLLAKAGELIVEVVEIAGREWSVRTGDLVGRRYLALEVLDEHPDYQRVAGGAITMYHGAIGPGFDGTHFEFIGRLGDIWGVETLEDWTVERFDDEVEARRAMAAITDLVDVNDDGDFIPVVPRDRGVVWWGGLWERTSEGVQPLQVTTSKRRRRSSAEPLLPTRILLSQREEAFVGWQGAVFTGEATWEEVALVAEADPDLAVDADDRHVVVLLDLAEEEHWLVRYEQLVEAAWLYGAEEWEQDLRDPAAVVELPDGRRVFGVEVWKPELAELLAGNFGQPCWYTVGRNGVTVHDSEGVTIAASPCEARPCPAPPGAELLSDDSYLGGWGSAVTALLRDWPEEWGEPPPGRDEG